MPLQQMLYREAYRMLGDSFEAEDAVQNLYMKLWERRGALNSVETPEAYCRCMLKNICIDRWKVLRIREKNCVPLDETIDDNAPPDVEKGEAKEFIEHFLANLTQQQRMIMKMQMQGCTTMEIADVTGLSEVNVRVTISRLRKIFREFYYR